MNIFQRIGKGIRQAALRIQNIFIPTIVPEEEEATPVRRPARSSAIRKKAMQEKEREAFQRALWMIQYAMENPENATAQRAKDKAITYMNKSKELTGKGNLQDWNRQVIAQKLINDKMSTKEGQEAIFKESLYQMNRNLNIKLTPDTYNTLKNITNTDSFKKMMELGKTYYKEIYGAVADQVDTGTDPARIEQTLDLFTRVGMDDFETFGDIVNMDPENYSLFYENVYEKIYDANPDLVDIPEVFNNILEEFDI